jgi:predicted transcriptional regulator
MRIINKQQYYFEEEEKNELTDFLWENRISLTDFAKMCGISNSLLTLILKGERPITKTTLKKFQKNGFTLKFTENFYK